MATTHQIPPRGDGRRTNRAIVLLVSVCIIFVVVSLVLQTRSMVPYDDRQLLLSPRLRTCSNNETTLLLQRTNASLMKSVRAHEKTIQELNLLNMTASILHKELELFKNASQQQPYGKGTSTNSQTKTTDSSWHELLQRHEQTKQQLEELNKTASILLDELYRSYSNYLIHTPKTGGQSLIKLLNIDRIELSIVREQGLQWKNRVCNHAVANTESWWPRWVTDRCWLHASEYPYSSQPDHVYAVVRDPFHQVPSMYFHCTESFNHEKKAHHMPDTMDEWLQEWVKVMEESNNNLTNRTLKQMKTRFKCYNPINLQSTFLAYDPNVTDLSEKYDVVGLTTELSKTACLISISIHGGLVPKRCNCTAQLSTPTTKRAHLKRRRNELKEKFEQRGGRHVLVKRVDHGVTNHGDTVNLTDSERVAIEKLTQNDVLLYQAAERAFWNKVEFVEKQYSIKLC